MSNTTYVSWTNKKNINTFGLKKKHLSQAMIDNMVNFTPDFFGINFAFLLLILKNISWNNKQSNLGQQCLHMLFYWKL